MMPKLDPDFFERFAETRLVDILTEYRGEAESVAAWTYAVAEHPDFIFTPDQLANVALLAFAVGSELTRQRIEFKRLMGGG